MLVFPCPSLPNITCRGDLVVGGKARGGPLEYQWSATCNRHPPNNDSISGRHPVRTSQTKKERRRGIRIKVVRAAGFIYSTPPPVFVLPDSLGRVRVSPGSARRLSGPFARIPAARIFVLPRSPVRVAPRAGGPPSSLPRPGSLGRPSFPAVPARNSVLSAQARSASANREKRLHRPIDRAFCCTSAEDPVQTEPGYRPVLSDPPSGIVPSAPPWGARSSASLPRKNSPPWHPARPPCLAHTSVGLVPTVPGPCIRRPSPDRPPRRQPTLSIMSPAGGAGCSVISALTT